MTNMARTVVPNFIGSKGRTKRVIHTTTIIQVELERMREKILEILKEREQP